jgi:nucleoside-diphosphate kinase
MEETLVIIKPDAVARGLIGEIITRLERKKLQLVKCWMTCPTLDIVGQHYKDHADKLFFDDLCKFMSGGDIFVSIWKGEDAIAVVRGLVGTKHIPGTIRGDYASTTRHNCIHASDSPDSAVREISLWLETRKVSKKRKVDEQ